MSSTIPADAITAEISDNMQICNETTVLQKWDTHDLDSRDLNECLKDVLTKQSAFVTATEMLCAKVEKMKLQTEKDLILMEQVRKQYEENISSFKDEVHLNIGGARFTTSKETLLAEPDNFFACMVRSGRWQPNKSGEYFVDRDPTHFPAILNYFRMLKSGGVAELRVDNLDVNAAKSLADDIDFYQIQSLSGWVEARTHQEQPGLAADSASIASEGPLFRAFRSLQAAGGRGDHLPPDETTRDRFIRFVDAENISISAAIPFEWQAV